MFPVLITIYKFMIYIPIRIKVGFGAQFCDLNEETNVLFGIDNEITKLLLLMYLLSELMAITVRLSYINSMGHDSMSDRLEKLTSTHNSVNSTIRGISISNTIPD